MSNLSKSLTVAHLSWVTWVIHSRLLICLERPEHFAHSHSFVLSDLSKSLTVPQLIWAKWANEGMSYEQMSEFPALVGADATVNIGFLCQILYNVCMFTKPGQITLHTFQSWQVRILYIDSGFFSEPCIPDSNQQSNAPPTIVEYLYPNKYICIVALHYSIKSLCCCQAYIVYQA